MKNQDSKKEQPCTLHSVIHWVDVVDKLPELEKKVMIVCKDGYVGWGMMAERMIYERNKETRLFQINTKLTKAHCVFVSDCYRTFQSANF
jgi:hypothetical protein